ncbi:hypothetical protein K435DRAFT_800850 [Dendrothele bispora CBS 962.96]|uniref:Uncharacterized protein n=1 Tax=Dendrothele bispora (strain CBS 962.96) TaxID=1314807 RepID=A0A4S8LR63_DENBC|nr:hypothetical protein K435DRAFT_800850 [Dendrothele bispora CBS 962.96]
MTTTAWPSKLWASTKVVVAASIETLILGGKWYDTEISDGPTGKPIFPVEVYVGHDDDDTESSMPSGPPTSYSSAFSSSPEYNPTDRFSGLRGDSVVTSRSQSAQVSTPAMGESGMNNDSVRSTLPSTSQMGARNEDTGASMPSGPRTSYPSTSSLSPEYNSFSSSRGDSVATSQSAQLNTAAMGGSGVNNDSVHSTLPSGSQMVAVTGARDARYPPAGVVSLDSAEQDVATIPPGETQPVSAHGTGEVFSDTELATFVSLVHMPSLMQMVTKDPLPFPHDFDAESDYDNLMRNTFFPGAPLHGLDMGPLTSAPSNPHVQRAAASSPDLGTGDGYYADAGTTVSPLQNLSPNNSDGNMTGSLIGESYVAAVASSSGGREERDEEDDNGEGSQKKRRKIREKKTEVKPKEKKPEQPYQQRFRASNMELSPPEKKSSGKRRA